MENTKKQLNFWRCAAIIELIALLVIGAVFASGRSAAPADAEPTADAEVVTEPLTLWSEGSVPKQKLIDYVTSVTDENSMDSTRVVFPSEPCPNTAMLRISFTE